MQLQSRTVSLLLKAAMIGGILLVAGASSAYLGLVRPPSIKPVKDAQIHFDSADLLPAADDKLCGPRSVATVAMLEGTPFNMDAFIEICPKGPNGVSMLDMKRSLERMDFKARGAMLKWTELIKLSSPAVLFVSNNHYVAVDPRDFIQDGDKRKIRFFNSPHLARYVSEADLRASWHGESLLFEKDSSNLTYGHPLIAFDRLLQDFGTQKATDLATCDFTFKNLGAAALKIIDVEKSCGCTNAVAEPTEIPSGGTGKIHVSIELNGKAGVQSQTISVRTNDPANRVINLLYQGFVEQDLYSNKNMLLFSHLSRGMESSQQLFVQSRMNHSMKVKSLEILPDETNPAQDVEYAAKLVNPPAGFTAAFPTQFVAVTAKAKQSARFGEHNARLSVELENGEVRYLDIPIHAVVETGLSVEPESISFGLIRPGSVVVRSFALRSESGEIPPADKIKFEFQSAPGSELLPKVVATRTEGKLRYYDLSMTVPQSGQADEQTAGSGSIRLSSNDGQELAVNWTYVKKPLGG